MLQVGRRLECGILREHFQKFDVITAEQTLRCDGVAAGDTVLPGVIGQDGMITGASRDTEGHGHA